MDEIGRLRQEIRNAETALRNMRGLAEWDEQVLLRQGKDPEKQRKRNAASIRQFEERLRVAQDRLNAALAAD